MALDPCPGSIIEMLPHRPPLVLLDEPIGISATEIRVRAVIGPDHPFLGERGLPCHILLELMAQACGVFVGAQALAAGQPIRPGFLLGTRNFRSECDWVAPGSCLDVIAQLVFRDEAMAVFDCAVERDAERICSARLSVYQPPQGQSLLREGEPS